MTSMVVPEKHSLIVAVILASILLGYQLLPFDNPGRIDVKSHLSLLKVDG